MSHTRTSKQKKISHKLGPGSLELRRFAERMGFEGSDDEWDEVYREACAKFTVDGTTGFQ